MRFELGTGKELLQPLQFDESFLLYAPMKFVQAERC